MDVKVDAFNSNKVRLRDITKNLQIMNLKELLTQFKSSLEKNQNIIQKATISIFLLTG